MAGPATRKDSSDIRRYAYLSIGAALVTVTLKAGAYYVTGSVGLLSDALESLVNLAGALMTLTMLIVAAKPPDEQHAFGHSKAEYFSSGFEGGLILVAALTIIGAALPRLVNPEPLEQVGIGLLIAVLASVVNLFVALALRRGAKRYDSVALEADSHHLMTDVWTSVGVVVGVAAVMVTGWTRLDPLIALVVAANIIRVGVSIMRQSARGLMDSAIPTDELERVENVLRVYEDRGVEFHALRTRQAGRRRFVSVHVLTPGDWTVHRGHELVEQIEADIGAALPNTSVLTHLEPRGEAVSWEDVDLDRFAEEAV
jgi:cation diffusion facilitator family transporter